MNKVANLSFLSLAVSVALFGTSPTLKADKCTDCTTTDLAQCFGTCNQTDSKMKAACGVACVVAMGICKGAFCPKLYAVRNASMVTMNFFDKNGKLLGTRSPISPSRLDIDASDFPLTAAWADECPDLKDPKCTKNALYGYVLKDPGCYTLWKPGKGSDIYPMDMVCRTQLKTTDHRKPVSPPPATSQSKNKNPQSKKATVK